MSRTPCSAPQELLAFVAGGLTADARAQLESHAAECADCRTTLAALGMLAEPERAEESAALDRLSPASSPLAVRALQQVTTARQRARPGLSRRWSVGIAALATAASIALVLQTRRPERALENLALGERPLEAALSDLPYAPYQPQRSADHPGEELFERPLRQLLEAHERGSVRSARRLATLYLLRGGAGDALRAQRLLDAAGGDAESENARAVLLFAQGDLLGALEACERALKADGQLVAARFNRALFLERLGLLAAAADGYAQLSQAAANAPWAAEAEARSMTLRAALGKDGSDPSEKRRTSFLALLSASTQPEFERAWSELAALPGGTAPLEHLARTARTRSSEQLAAHAALFARYRALRAETRTGRGSADAVDALVADAALDPLTLVPALQFAAFQHGWQGQFRVAQELQLRALHVCAEAGCDPVSEGIAADELAEAAGRDGDFLSAHRLQSRAERLFHSAGATLQSGELEQKRAHLLLQEGRNDEAALAIATALRLLSPLQGDEATSATATAASIAAGIASSRHLVRAELELHQDAVALLSKAKASALTTQLTSAIALDSLTLGESGEAALLLHAQLDRQLAAGDRSMAGRVRRTLAMLALAKGDGRAALENATAALADLTADGAGLAWSDDLAETRTLRARALLAVEGSSGIEEAVRELRGAVELAEKAARRSDDLEAQRRFAKSGIEPAIELALLEVRAQRPAAELLAPLDDLHGLIERRTAPGAVARDWSAHLPEKSCLLVLLPAEQSLVRLAFTAAASVAGELPISRTRLATLLTSARASRAGDALPDPRAPTPAESALAAALFDSLPASCAAATTLWLMVESPLDAFDVTALALPEPLSTQAAVGLATSLAPLLEREPLWPPRPSLTLLIDAAQPRDEEGSLAAQLPAAGRERELLEAALGAAPSELSGVALTPQALLARLPALDLLHASVHGLLAPSGALQLSGELGRLSAQEISAARLPTGARVVLASCHAAPSESALAEAFLRAGALEVVAAAGAIDDAAAARWAATFYPALSRGRSFVEANHEALLAEPPSTSGTPRAWFVVIK